MENPERNAEIVRRQYRLFNERRHDDALEDWAEDSFVEVVSLGVRVDGREAYRALLDVWSAAFPDGHADVRRLHAGPDFVVAEFRGSGTWSIPAGRTGTKIAADLCDVWTFANGRISGLRIYCDLSNAVSTLGLTGAVPAAGGGLE